MKPPVVEYRRTTTVEEALGLLAEHGDDAKVLAGGQSLISLLNFRLSRPAVLVDIGPVEDLALVERDGNVLVVGALVTHRTVETSAGAPAFAGYESLPATARWIGHLPIRTRGTFGGSVIHGDPSAEWPLLCTALQAELVLASSAGVRRISIDDLYRGFLTTSLTPDELLLRVEFHRPPMGAALCEFSRRRGDFAIVAVAVALRWDRRGACTEARIVVGGVDSVPLRVSSAELGLIGERLDGSTIEECAATAARAVSPTSDLHGSARYRRHLVRVLTARALSEAAAEMAP